MKKIDWIDGIKGYACIVVMLGHSVACIFPNVFFGNTYKSHTFIEEWIHESPLMLFFNSTAMVGLFFFVSGFLIAKKEYNQNIIKRLLLKYIKYLPMVLVGTVSCYIVMKINSVNSISISNISYAGQYVNLYNNFIPGLLGKEGLIPDTLINCFIRGSIYNNTLWFISVIFLGGLLIEELVRDVKNKKVLVVILIVLYIFFSRFSFWSWKLQYIEYMCLGAVVSFVSVEKIKYKKIISWLFVIVGCYRIACPNDMVGIYAPIKQMVLLNKYFPGWGIVLLILGIQMNPMIQKLFSNKMTRFIAENSFAIYAIQWSIIISIGCGITRFLYYSMSANYNIAGIVGIVTSSALIIGVAWIYNKMIYLPILSKINKTKGKEK